MNFLRYVVILVVFLLLSPLAQAQNLGLVFVHGTRDHREDAFGEYWKTDFIKKLVQGLPNPDNFFVVHCDFSHYMWEKESAECAVQQMEQFINEKNITELIFYTHSDGGNVVRWILSNPTFDNRYLHIKNTTTKVIAVAPSSGGTLLADEVLEGNIFETSLAWLLDYVSDAVKQQRIGDMLIFNQELLLGTNGRPTLPAPFQVVVGTDVVASPFSSLSYCNGYLQNSSLKLTKLYLDKCADGFLNCSSQTAAGSVWFYDKEKTDYNNPLSHNQSRHSCSGLEKIMVAAFEGEGSRASHSLDAPRLVRGVHRSYVYDLPVQPTKSYECTACADLARESIQDNWTNYSALPKNPITNAQRSLRYKQFVTMKQLRQGVVIATTAPKAVVRISPQANASVPELELITPNQKQVKIAEATEDYQNNATFGEGLKILPHQTVWQFKQELGQGQFTLVSNDKSFADDTVYTIHVYDKYSTNYMQVETDKLHYQFGDTVTISITMKNNDAEYALEDLEAFLVNPEGESTTLELNKIGPNKFQASYSMDSLSNNQGRTWYIEANAYSELGQSIIRRNGHTAFSYSIPSASLINVTKVSSNPLVVSYQVEVATASRYNLQAVLLMQNDNGQLVPIQTAHASQWLEPGMQSMRLSFDNSELIDEDRLYLGYMRLLDYGQLTFVYQYDKPIPLSQE